jgi:hypothetical protein
MHGNDAHHQHLFDQSSLTRVMVHVQYGIASDDSQNDCTLDEYDSASSDMCRMSPFPDLVSTTAAQLHEHHVVCFISPCCV